MIRKLLWTLTCQSRLFVGWVKAKLRPKSGNTFLSGSIWNQLCRVSCYCTSCTCFTGTALLSAGFKDEMHSFFCLLEFRRLEWECSQRSTPLPLPLRGPCFMYRRPKLTPLIRTTCSGRYSLLPMNVLLVSELYSSSKAAVRDWNAFCSHCRLNRSRWGRHWKGNCKRRTKFWTSSQTNEVCDQCLEWGLFNSQPLFICIL